MVSITNECGSRNGFGFFDTKSKEIALKRPCFRKKEAMEAYEWIDRAKDSGLVKFSIGIGNVESFVADGYGDSLYSSAREVIKQAIEQTKTSDTIIIKNILDRLKECKDVQFLYLKCISFEDQPELFLALLNVIKNLNKLIHIDLTGCYMSSEQLVELAEVISLGYASQVVWPELCMDDRVISEVVACFEKNNSVVVFENTPFEMQEIAKRNRRRILMMAKDTLAISDDQVADLRKYKASVRLTVSFEKHRLVDLQKSLESVIAS